MRSTQPVFPACPGHPGFSSTEPLPTMQKLNDLNSIILISLITLSSFGCQNDESEKYINTENEAINDIILQMTQFEEMKRINEWHDEKPTLYIISSLGTGTVWTQKPKGYIAAINGPGLSKEETERNKKDYKEDLARYEREEELFRKLKNGTIEKRNLNYPFKNAKINIQLIDAEEIHNLETKEYELGYLSISRIVFNQDFTKGYLYYSFFCGIGCAWGDNIEISKVNGKWEITEYFSGGIA